MVNFVPISATFFMLFAFNSSATTSAIWINGMLIPAVIADAILCGVAAQRRIQAAPAASSPLAALMYLFAISGQYRRPAAL